MAQDGHTAPAAAGESEQQLRRRLGIPADARRVIIFGESSHWDPNWLFTSEQYYRLRIRRILDAAVEQLTRQPRRVFSVECVFFLRMYWEREPHRRDAVRRLVNEGRLRLTSSGITTPDTLLPDTEAIIRDYLLGQQWLRDNGMTVEPTLTYLPDDFGHSPGLPALLRGLGFEQLGVSRIDGMFFVGADFRRRHRFPLPGSTAQLLLERERSLDFVWRGHDGSELLCHWNAHTYFHGDMLAHVGVIRWMGLPLALPWRTERHVARRIESFVADLAPVSRTPYLYCPIGCDFASPIEGLVELLDRHNARRHGDSGTWAVNAGMDDYLALVAHHRHRLPVLEQLDPNPYWMGFYGSRPEIKHLCRRTTRKLKLADKLAAVAVPASRADDDSGALHPDLDAELDEAWNIIAVSNHHDFITGTSPDRVVAREQMPWLQRAESLADSALSRLRCGCVGAVYHPLRQPPEWELARGRLEVQTPHYSVALAESSGGCIVSYRVDGRELLTGPANDVVAYHDSGGLWRMGHEYAGGELRPVERISAAPARIEAEELEGVLRVRVEGRLRGRRIVRWLWLDGRSPVIRMRLEGSAARRLTVTCRFPTLLRGRELTMDVAGGVIRRPPRKLYDPTFWPALSFVHLRQRSAGDDAGLAAFLGGPAAVTFDGEGALEWIALRNAHRERAYRLLPVLAHPATGTDPHNRGLDYGVVHTPEGDHVDNQLSALARRELRRAALPAGPHHDLELLAEGLVTVDHPAVEVAAVKRASRGRGIIVRLTNHGPVDGASALLSCAFDGPARAILCDARERHLQRLPVEDGRVRVPLSAAVLTVRLEGEG